MNGGISLINGILFDWCGVLVQSNSVDKERTVGNLTGMLYVVTYLVKKKH